MIVAAIVIYAALRISSLPSRRTDWLSTNDKLDTARRYLGQIANRESINEARKVANKALKETA